MTPARDPKQLFLRATWMRNRGGYIMDGAIMEVASGGGIMDEESWGRRHGGRHHGGGIWRMHLEEASWMRNHGGGIMEEASGGGIMDEES